MRVRYDEDARKDLRSAVRCTRSRARGWVPVFTRALVRAAERLIADAPSLHPIIDRVGDALIRRALIPEFPYGLLYMEHHDGLWILAVMHLHRRPGYWQKRTHRVPPKPR